jgi:hypothetical protein
VDTNSYFLCNEMLFLGLINEAPLHKDIWGSGGRAPPLLTSALNYQLHASVALTSERRPQVLIEQEAEWAP